MADLRAEVRDENEAAREAWLAQLARDWSSVEMDASDRALCAYAEKLTRHPADMSQADLDGLRRLGLDDEQIQHAIQVIAYFNYINRVADAVGVDLEAGMEPGPDRHGRQGS